MKKKNKYSSIIDTPIGKLGLVTLDKKLIRVNFLSSKSELVSSKDPFVKKVTSEIKKYFRNPKYKFNCPLFFQGTSLQINIWNSLQKIPVGRTITYGKLAEKLGTGPRVIGNACRANPLPVVIPCHRVIAAKDIGGFCGRIVGDKINIKRWLLNHENKNT